jgi:flagellar biogenesis protein FliO
MSRGWRPVFLVLLITGFLLLAASYAVSAAQKGDENPGEKIEAKSAVPNDGGKQDAPAVALPKGGEEPGGGAIRDFREDEFKPKVVEESYAWLIFKTIMILGLLVGVFYYFFRFVTKKAGMNVLGQDVFHVLAVLPIGPNKFLQVVDFAGKLLLLGVSDSGINLITEIKDKEEIDRIRLLGSRSVQARTDGFQNLVMMQVGGLVSKFLEKRSAAKHDAAGQDPRESFDDLNYLRRQKDRLKKMNGEEDE